MDADGLNVISSLISSLGFPIFVAVWMLAKNSKDAAEMKVAIQELTIAIKLMNERNGEK